MNTLAQGKEGSAAVATSVEQGNEKARDTATPRKLRIRPPKLGPPKSKLALAKAREEDGADGVATPAATPPTTPRGRLYKFEGPITALRLTKPTQRNQKPRTTISDGLRPRKLPKIAQAVAEIDTNEGNDRLPTSGGLTRKPPKLGRPKAEKVAMARKCKSVEGKPSASETRDQSVEAERSAPDFESEDAKAETSTHPPIPDSAKAERSTRTPIPESDGGKISTKVPGTIRVQASKASPVSEDVETEHGEANPISNSTNVQVSEAAPDHYQSLQVITEKARAATTEDQLSRPPKFKHSKAELESQGHSNKADTRTPGCEPGSIQADTRTKSAMNNKSPETRMELIGYAVPESPHPRPRPPKLGRPKAEVELQKHGTKTDVRGINHEPSRVTAETSGRACNDNKAPETDIQKASVAKQGFLRPRPKPAKLGRPKAELAIKEAKKLPKKEPNSTSEEPYTESSRLEESKAEHECATADPGQAIKDTDQTARETIP